MKAISFVEAKDIIGGALNPFAGLVKGAQLGYDTGASIMGMVGGCAPLTRPANGFNAPPIISFASTNEIAFILFSCSCKSSACAKG